MHAGCSRRDAWQPWQAVLIQTGNTSASGSATTAPATTAPAGEHEHAANQQHHQCATASSSTARPASRSDLRRPRQQQAQTGTQVAMEDQALSVTATIKSERAGYSRSEQPARCLASLRATEAVAPERCPLDLVLVIDKSGSMAGEKMELTKQTANLVAKELGDMDRLSIITYDSDVSCAMKLSNMDAHGKKLAAAAISSIHPGSTTNLSGGLTRGLEEIQAVGNPAETTSVLLLTDGHANQGIRDTKALTGCIDSILAARSTPCTIFTFGYGADHNAEMLRSISDCGGGQYYHMENGDAVASSFADCIGGLFSVVAQNVRLHLQASPSASVKVLSQGYKTSTDPTTGIVQVHLGDIYSEENKDILFEVELPAGDITTTVTTSLSYLDVLRAELVASQHAHVTLVRSDETSVEAEIQVVEQTNRVEMVMAMKRANELALQGQYARGRKVLEETIEHLKLSPGAEDSALTKKLIADLDECHRGMQDHRSFTGSEFCRQQCVMQSHNRQRMSHCTPGRALAEGKEAWSTDSPYDTNSKRTMRSKWTPAATHATTVTNVTTVASATGGASASGAVTEKTNEDFVVVDIPKPSVDVHALD